MPTVRPFVAGDLAALEGLLARARAAGDLAASSDPTGTLLPVQAAETPGQLVVAEDGGAFVAFAQPGMKVVVVDPDHRRQGIGRALIEAAAVIERGRGEADLLMGVLPGDVRGAAFLAATGFRFHSTLWDLELPPNVPATPPAWPSGHSARPYDREIDLAAWIALFNAAFADHPTPLQLDEPSWRAFEASLPIVDADTVLVADAAGNLVGFCATEPKRDEGRVDERAEVWSLGVRPDRQGAGLGRQLLRWGVGHLRGLGVRTVTLSVNGRNPLALGLYESEGFVRTGTRERWSRPLTAEG